ncbi:hypothetical protein H5410_031993, partial [Solanum commersonii]
MEDDLGFTVVNFSRLADSGNREHPHDHEWFVLMLIKPRHIFYMGEENSMQLESSINSDSTNLAIVENVHAPDYENNDWVRSGVDGIIIDMKVHTQASPNNGESNLEEGNDIENESDLDRWFAN